MEGGMVETHVIHEVVDGVDTYFFFLVSLLQFGVTSDIWRLYLGIGLEGAYSLPGYKDPVQVSLLVGHPLVEVLSAGVSAIKSPPAHPSWKVW